MSNPTGKGGFATRKEQINKRGRPRIPKSAAQLNKLLLEIAAEELTNPNNGESINRLRLMLRGMMTSKQSADKQHILDRLYGKIPQPVELSGKDGKDLAIIVKVDIDPDKL